MLSLKAISTSALCPFCKSPLLIGGPVSRCFVCKTPHHVDCWRDHESRCSVFQCIGNQTLPTTEQRYHPGRHFYSWFYILAISFFSALVFVGGDFFVVPRVLFCVIGAIYLTCSIHAPVNASLLKILFRVIVSIFIMIALNLPLLVYIYFYLD
jgi:hypothetical protein